MHQPRGRRGKATPDGPDHAALAAWLASNSNEIQNRVTGEEWERLSRSGRYDLTRRIEAMLPLIAKDAPLGRGWLVHPLKGDWADHCACHIGGDFLLTYQTSANDIIFVRAGTHSELFEE